jgi:predicted transcriptional regulator
MKTISLRLPDGLHARVVREAKRKRSSKAAVVRAAVEQSLQPRPRSNGKRGQRRPTAGELAADLCGSIEGPSDLSTNPKYMEGFGL